MPPPQKVRLGDLLIQQGLLTEEQLKIALDEQKRTGRKLGRVFVESGYVTEEGISQALARQLRIPFVDLKNFTPKPDLIKLLPEAPARRFRAMVLAQLRGEPGAKATPAVIAAADQIDDSQIGHMAAGDFKDFIPVAGDEDEDSEDAWFLTGRGE